MLAILDFKMADISYTTGNNLMWFIDSKNVVLHTKIISLAYKLVKLSLIIDFFKFDSGHFVFRK